MFVKHGSTYAYLADGSIIHLLTDPDVEKCLAVMLNPPGEKVGHGKVECRVYRYGFDDQTFYKRFFHDFPAIESGTIVPTTDKPKAKKT